MRVPVSLGSRNCLLAAALAGVVNVSAYADDIDVYKAQVNAQQKPNILFVLDYSGSMAREALNGESRISVLRTAMDEILDANVDNINAGLGSLFSDSATGIRWPISPLSAYASTVDADIPDGKFTVKDIIKNRMNELDAENSTATVDALVEAAQYFRGDPVTHNDSPLKPFDRHLSPRWDKNNNRYHKGHSSASLPSSYSPSNAWDKDTSKTYYCNDYSGSGGPDYCAQKINSDSKCETVGIDDTSTTGYERIVNLWGEYKRCEYKRSVHWETPRYNSPITDQCEAQTNAIILITDGEPTKVKKGASLRSLVGNDLSVCEDLSTSIFAEKEKNADAGNCATEIVRALAHQTVNPALPDSRVNTYTVGFNISKSGKKFLKKLAFAGKGEFYDVQNPAKLSEALTAAINEIKSSSQNFSELSVDVDKASFSHSNRVYYNLFKPSVRRAWKGNLKGYFVTDGGLEDINGSLATKDDAFIDTAQSFWSDEADGNKVSAGGASEQLTAGTRNLHTYTMPSVTGSGIELDGSNGTALRQDNDKITNALMGMPKDAASTKRRNAALQWIQNAPMGDPLHSKSVSVNYGNRQIVYVMTNQGLLHAIDATRPSLPNSSDSAGGDEIFAFMPQRLLKNLPDLQTNTVGDPHIYGLDGALTRWHDDTDKDGIVNNDESVMLYFGMRRGGSAYYAMDVSKPEKPTLKWVIDENTKGFERLAQSWSRMSIIKVMHNGKPRRVLAFGGGYDAGAQDDVNQPVASTGNAIYMVGEDGSLLWTASSNDNPDMKFSIASDLAVIDSDGDQLADRFYVGDLGGQLWRVDFYDIKNGKTVTRLADLSEQNQHQPFFYPPSIALNGPLGERYLSVAIGSGNRTSPLTSDVENNFYMIRDTDLARGKPSSNFITVTPDKLHDATNNNIQSPVVATADIARKDLKAKRGWRIRLADDEKSLSAVLTYEGKMMATTFRAARKSDANECAFDSTGRFYVMDIHDASIIEVLDNADENASDNDEYSETDDEPTTHLTHRSRTLNTQGIPSSPVPVLAKGTDTVQIFVGKESVDEFARTLSRVYWHAR